VLVDDTVVRQGRYYDVNTENGEHPIILVHSIFQTDNGLRSVHLHVTKFFRRADIPLLNGECDFQSGFTESSVNSASDGAVDAGKVDQESSLILLSYSDWASRGRESDAEVMCASDILEILSECHVNWFPYDEVGCNGVEHLKKYTVKWGFSSNESRDHAYFRQIPIVENVDTAKVILPSRPTVVDLFCGMGGFSRGFSDSGMTVVAGVDKDWYAGSSFKVFILPLD
jgi:hypothetical protein